MIDAAAFAAEIDSLEYPEACVQPEFIDANGHMNVAYYTLLFDKALDIPWGHIGIFSQQSLQTGLSTFALETHVTYQRELKLGDAVKFTFQLLDYDSKRVHYFMTMHHAAEMHVAATCEQISMCMNMATRRGAFWSPPAAEKLAALFKIHKLRPRATEVGRVIGIRR